MVVKQFPLDSVEREGLVDSNEALLMLCRCMNHLRKAAVKM